MHFGLHSSSLAKTVLALISFLAVNSAFAQQAGSPQEQPASVDMQTQTPSSTSQTAPAPAAPTPAPTPEDAGGHFSVTPYLWFAGVRGTVGALGRNASVHVSDGDLLSHFDIGLMGAAEARYDRVVINGDLMWIRVSDGKALPFTGLGAVSADVRVGQLVWTSKLGYRVINSQKFKLDANAGIRYWHLGQKLSFNPSLLGINFNGSQNWVDLVVGGRAQLPLGKKAVIDLAGDVGGWDATAKLDYQFAALLGFKLCPKWTAVMGYRYLFIDYRQNNAVFNTITSGGIVGLTYTFK
jgi:hypothetical protein